LDLLDETLGQKLGDDLAGGTAGPTFNAKLIGR